MNLSKLKVKTKNGSYNVIIGNNILRNFLNILKKNSISFNKCLIVIDDKVPKKILKKIISIKKKKNYLLF